QVMDAVTRDAPLPPWTRERVRDAIARIAVLRIAVARSLRVLRSCRIVVGLGGIVVVVRELGVRVPWIQSNRGVVAGAVVEAGVVSVIRDDQWLRRAADVVQLVHVD